MEMVRDRGKLGRQGHATLGTQAHLMGAEMRLRPFRSYQLVVAAASLQVSCICGEFSSTGRDRVQVLTEPWVISSLCPLFLGNPSSLLPPGSLRSQRRGMYMWIYRHVQAHTLVYITLFKSLRMHPLIRRHAWRHVVLKVLGLTTGVGIPADGWLYHICWWLGKDDLDGNWIYLGS